MSSFTSHDDLCGTTLLNLVCHGHILIAKVIKSSNEIPICFHSAGMQDEQSDNSNGSDGDENKQLSKVWNLFGRRSGDNNSGGNSNNSRENQFLYGMKDCGTPEDSSTTTTTSADDDSDKFNSILFDFNYLADPERYDSHADTRQQSSSSTTTTRVTFDTNTTTSTTTTTSSTTPTFTNNPNDTEQLEREFQSTHQTTLIQFHELFTDIYNFYLEVHQFSTELQDGYFVQHTVESVLLENHDGRQLLCELFYLYGSLLILLDLYIPGSIRERLIIAHYRYCGASQKQSSTISNFEELCKLFHRSNTKQSTSPSSSKKDSHHLNKKTSSSKASASTKGGASSYQQTPIIQEDLLTRLPLPENLIQSIIECLIVDDLYPNYSQSFPNFRHRSTKLARQASMLCILLFFNPSILISDSVKMRQVVDKFFPDSWNFPLYNGYIIDLSIEWGYGDRLPAAKEALMEYVLQPEKVKSLRYENSKVILESIDEIRRYQTMWTDSVLLDHGNDILNCMRKTNVALRWEILHRESFLNDDDDDGSGGVERQLVDANDIVSLLLVSSQFELDVKTMYSRLLKDKEQILMDSQSKAVNQMIQVSRYFSGKENNLEQIDRHEGLLRWFESMADEIKSLTYQTQEHFTLTGRKIQLCIQSLDEVEQFDLIDRNVQLKSILAETKTNLFHMVRIVSIKDDIISSIDLISDFSYGREIVALYIPTFHLKAIHESKCVGLLRAFFLKMGTFLVLPSARLASDPSKSNELKALTKFYATDLIKFVKTILDIIPISIFSTLTRIADIKEKSLLSIPSKIDSNRLADYSQLDARYDLAKITHELSTLTKGIFRMEATHIGSMEINPRKLLEEGLRKEIVRQVSLAFHSNLQFKSHQDKKKLSLMAYKDACLRSFGVLSRRIEGFKRAIEYMQDFLGIAGLQVFLEETSRVIAFNSRREAMKYMNEKERIASKKKSSDLNIIPQFHRTDDDLSVLNFMGRTMNALMKLTDPNTTVYSHNLNGWYLKDGEHICGLRTMSNLRKSIGVQGLVGLEFLLCHRITHELGRFFKFYSNIIKSYGAILERARDGLFPEWKTPKDGIEFYNIALRKTGKLMVPLMVCFYRVGQMQLLRKILKCELHISSQTDAANLRHATITLNKALMNEFAQDSTRTREDSSMEELFMKTSELLTSMGAGDFMSTIFVKTDPLEGLPVLIVLYIIHHAPKLEYDRDFGALLGKDEEPTDGWPIITGILTVLRHFHSSYTKSVFALLGQYVKCKCSASIREASQRKDDDILGPHLKNVLIFMIQLRAIGNLSHSVIFDYVPQYLLEMFDITTY